MTLCVMKSVAGLSNIGSSALAIPLTTSRSDNMPAILLSGLSAITQPMRLSVRILQASKINVSGVMDKIAESLLFNMLPAVIEASIFLLCILLAKLSASCVENILRMGRV